MWFFVLPAWPSMPYRCPSCAHERPDWLILCIQSGRLYGTGRYCGGFPARPAYRRCLTSPWGNEDTQQLIDILGKYKVKATFFVVGEWVDKYPESVKALHDAGHEVMNHSNTHAHMSQLSKDEIVADVEACNDKIEAVTGVRPTLIRPPYGEYDNNVITAIRSIGMEPIQWDVDGPQTASSRWGASVRAARAGCLLEKMNGRSFVDESTAITHFDPRSP